MNLKIFTVHARRVVSCMSLLVPAFAAAHAPAFPLPFHPTIIEAPNGGTTYGADVNNAGVVLGSYSGGPFVWSSRMGFVPLEIQGDFVLVRAINECNQVVGEMLGHAALWNAPDEVEDLGTLGGLGSTATDINDRGDVVGSAGNGGDNGQPFLWTEAEGMRQIFDCGSYGGIARGINNRREIVGRCTEPGDRAFYWSERTGKIDIDVPGFPETDAISINNRGEVVGVAQATTPAGIVRGFKWTLHGGPVLLRDLGNDFSFARFNNRVGWAIGEAVDDSGIRNSVLWITPRFGFQIHPGYGDGSEVGGGLNDRGDLLDTVSFAPSSTRAVLWQPPKWISRLLARAGSAHCLRPKN